jgi:hypothetical protein
LRRNADLLDSKLTAEALGELAGLLGKNDINLKQLADHLNPELIKALGQQKLDPEQLKKLSDVLRHTSADLARQMEKLHKAGLIDAETLSRCRRAGECDCEGLASFLRDNKQFSLTDLKSLCKGGKGGVTRGPGAAPLTWRKPNGKDEAQFKEEVLPPGAVDAMRSTSLQEVRGKNIVHRKTADPAASGALARASAGSGSANTEVLLPRHRAAVERYFERKPHPEK